MTTFPPEILGEIFTRYVHSRPRKIRQRNIEDKSASLRCITAYPDSQALPTDLTQVCRLWRDTAISIPQLWATITYVFKPGRGGCVKTFKLWLERSAGSDGTRPLDLTIKQCRYLTSDPQHVFRQIISLAISQHRRWRHVSLDLLHDCEELGVDVLETCRLNRKKMFDVCAPGEDAFEVDPPPLHVNPDVWYTKLNKPL